MSDIRLLVVVIVLETLLLVSLLCALYRVREQVARLEQQYARYECLYKKLYDLVHLTAHEFRTNVYAAIKAAMLDNRIFFVRKKGRPQKKDTQ